MNRSQPDQEVIGWRKWRLIPDEGVLRSLYRSTLWAPRERMVASCAAIHTRQSCSNSPQFTCKCGIYAALTQGGLESWRVPGTLLVDDQLVKGMFLEVYGRVSLWGRMVEMERGWRAEYAYPYDLYVVPRDQMDVDVEQIVRRLRSTYLVDCFTT